MNEKSISQKQILSRAIWLAFSNSIPMGMGFLHQSIAAKQTEESLFKHIQENNDSCEIYLDYCFGRMMKTKFKIDAQNNLSISPEVPRPEYQSWAYKYSTAQELIEATIKSL